MSRSASSFVLVVGVAFVCAGCGQQQSAETVAAREADMARFRQNVEAGDHALAVATGEGILRRYPGTAAADEVARTLPEIEVAAAAAVEERRLAELWVYQTGTEAGAAQSTASIFAGDGPDGAPVQLVLRRHADWGTSAYLHAEGGGFACPDPCTVALRFDGGPLEAWAASLPATGEPAIFIDDHEGLVARFADADRLEVEVVFVDGGPSTLAFEVGGFDPSRW
jgi:hypothetical protein